MAFSPGLRWGLAQLEKTSVGSEAAGGGRRTWKEEGKVCDGSVDHKAFLWFVPVFPKLHCRMCAPRGQQSTNPWEASCPPSSAKRAREGLWITVFHLADGYSPQEEPPG